MAKSINIGLLWHGEGSGNLGVGALTVGNMALIRQAAGRVGLEPAFHIFRPAELMAPYVHDQVVARHILNGRYMLSPSGYWRDLGTIDIMLDIGAGDSFADIYPDKRFAYIIATKELCLRRGIPLVLSPQTIGPFSRQPHRALARRCLNGARAVFARDPLSMQAARALAPDARLEQVIDVAFALPFTPQPKGPGVRVGINVSGLLYAGGYSGTNQFGLDVDYRQFTHQLIEALLARGDVRVELISHVYAPNLPRDDDPTAARTLTDRYPALQLAPDFSSPSAAKSYISGLDFLVAARMHATIAAYGSGVPVVPVSYSRKFEGLFGGLDYPWVLPVKGVSTEEAVAFTLDAFDRRDQLAADVARGTPIIADALERYISTLATLFAEVVPA